MKNSSYLLCGGYRKWSKNLQKNFAHHDFKSITYSKIASNNSDIKFFDYTLIKKLKFSVLASDRYSNNKYLIRLLHNNYKKPIFFEKPLSCTVAQLYKIKKLNLSNQIFINHQHTFTKAIDKIANFHNQNKSSNDIKIQIKFGKKGPEKDNQLLEWGPHVFSILNKLEDIRSYKFTYFSIKKKTKKKYNIHVKLVKRNIKISLVFGNNFPKKIYSLRYLNGNNLLEYNGLKPNYLIKNKKLLMVEKILPLQKSIVAFLNNNKKNFKDNFKSSVKTMNDIYLLKKKFKLYFECSDIL